VTKMLFAILIAIVLGTTPAAGDSHAPGERSQAASESSFFCNVKALSPAARRRHFDELGPMLRSRKIGVRELPNGYAFEFPADPEMITLVAEWVVGERACCPFFDIALTFDREGGPFRLTLSGREGTKEFIKVDAASWIE